MYSNPGIGSTCNKCISYLTPGTLPECGPPKPINIHNSSTHNDVLILITWVLWLSMKTNGHQYLPNICGTLKIASIWISKYFPTKLFTAL